MGLIQGGDADSWTGEGPLSSRPRVHRRFDASKTKQHSPNMFEAQVAAPRQSFTSPVTAAGVILGRASCIVHD